MSHSPTDLNLVDPIACYDMITASLKQAVASGRHGWHLLTVASIGVDGFPEARVVVLRGFDPIARRLAFHTDWRSPKVGELTKNPQLSLVSYDPGTRWQLRIRATASVHHLDEPARTAWQNAQPMSRIAYALPQSPSSELGDAAWAENPPIPDLMDEVAFANFCLIECEYDQLEVLELRKSGNRRARLEWHDGVPQLVRIGA